jgi:hypothetical protein
VDRSPDLASLDRRLAGPVMTRDKKDNPIAGIACALEGSIDCAPRLIETESVQVNDAVRLDGA